MRLPALVLAFLMAALPVLASDPAVGTWQTQPDRKDLTSHIQVRICDNRLCGRIQSAFDPSGQQVQTPNVGKELFWGMKPRGDGNYSGGTAWIPLLNVNATASMQLMSGGRLKVTGCKGPVCQSQVWKRLK